MCQARLDRKEAVEGPSDPPTGHRDSCVVLTASSPLPGSCRGNQVPGEDPQGHPVGWGSSDSSYLEVPATCLPEDPQEGLTASSEGAC